MPSKCRPGNAISSHNSGRHRGTAAGTRTGRQRGTVPAVGRESAGYLGDAVRSRPATGHRRRRGVGANGYSNDLAGMLMRDAVPGGGHGPARRSLSRRAGRPSHRLLLRQPHRRPAFPGPSPARVRPRRRGRRRAVRHGGRDGRAGSRDAVGTDPSIPPLRRQLVRPPVRAGPTDDALLALWGIDDDPAISGLPLAMLAPDERDAESHSWSKVLTEQRPTLAVLQHDSWLDRARCGTCSAPPPRSSMPPGC